MTSEFTQKIKVHRETNPIEHPLNDDAKINTESHSHLLLKLIKHRFFAPLLYITSGIILLFCIIMMFNTYFLHLKVETAVVSNMIETMISPMNGYVTDVFVAPGETVKKGTPLLKVENIGLERALQLAKLQVEESRLMIEYYEKLLTNEQARLKVYQKISHTRAVSAQTIVKMSTQNVMMQQHNLKRYTELNHKHYISEASLEEQQAKYIEAQEQLKNAKAQLRLEKHAFNAIDQGMYFTGTKTEGIEHDLHAEREAAKKKMKLNEQRVQIYENLIEKLTLKAPFDGQITQILKSMGNTTDNINPIIFIEKTSVNKTIIAYLTQEEIIHIGSSAVVKIYIPASGKTYHGKITEINRTDGFIDEVKAQYRWRDFQIDRSALVIITIAQSEQATFNQYAFSGMPVVVYFSKV